MVFRMVEVTGGKISIDGRNIREIGLDTLRQRLALVPQDSTLFLGTMRENLYVKLLDLWHSGHWFVPCDSDPQQSRTDAEVIEALRRAWLLPREGQPADPIAEAKFGLNTAVGDEGSLPHSSCTCDNVDDSHTLKALILVPERNSFLLCAVHSLKAVASLCSTRPRAASTTKQTRNCKRRFRLNSQAALSFA